ncbi:MAG: helix-turn-helix transcriptional regulator, partial [Pseudonocardiales bacterium]|nr:helix-turn-helix transcriptional regulator [Pseudonocardiales bacterium]
QTIGLAIWRVRDDRGKSLRVVAGLAGMSKDTLQRIETGERSPTLAELAVLADALQTSVSELTRLPVPAPANGHTDSTIAAIDLALMAVSQGLPGGQVLPVEVLRARVTAMVDALCRCERQHEIGAALPVLVRDLHTTITAGRDVAELLPLAAWLHTQVTVPWLLLAGASLDLCGQAVMLARQAAGEHGTAAPKGLVAAAGARLALVKGAFDIARAVLDAVSMPTNTSETMQLEGLLTLRRSLVAAVDKRANDAEAALDYAAELAERTGEGNAYGLGFGPVNVGLFRMNGLVMVGDYERTVSTAESLNPEAHDQVRQVYYWRDYGRALAHLPKRHGDAVRALRRAELISPHSVQRNQINRDTLAVLLRHSRRGSSTDQELRGMARRAGLRV